MKAFTYKDETFTSVDGRDFFHLPLPIDVAEGQFVLVEIDDPDPSRIEVWAGEMIYFRPTPYILEGTAYALMQLPPGFKLNKSEAVFSTHIGRYIVPVWYLTKDDILRVVNSVKDIQSIRKDYLGYLND